MKRAWYLASVAALLVTIVIPTAAVRAQDELASPTLRIDWDAFKKLYDSQAVVVIDVREAVSYEAGHIPRALSVPLAQIEGKATELKKLRKPIVLYCA